MTTLRWTRYLAVLTLLFFSHLASAMIYSSAMLNEANGLVDIVPNQAKQLALGFLTQRTLIDKSGKAPISITAEEPDNRTRTPGDTIDALRILARAEFNLGNKQKALKHLEEATSLATDYQLPYLLLDVQLIDIRLRWQINHNITAAKETIKQWEQSFSKISNPHPLARGLKYKMTMLQADIASEEGESSLAEELYSKAKPYADNAKSSQTLINYHVTVGNHYLAAKKYNSALSELLFSYWEAIERDAGVQLAEVNRLLGHLFYEKNVLDKAIEHLSQAADFYDNYEGSLQLIPILKRMGDIYYRQGKYNLALVHYFNAMDHEHIQHSIESDIDIRISLAATYLHLVNYPLAEQYLDSAEELLQQADIPRLKANALLLESGLARYKRHAEKAINDAQQALKIAQKIGAVSTQKAAYQLLYLGYELNGDYQQSLKCLKKYNSLANIEQQQLNQLNENTFRQQKEFVEQTLHLADQKEKLEQVNDEYRKFRKITFTLFVISALLFILLLRRGHIINIQRDELNALNQDLFTHSRSGLRNIRMLNARLPASLEKSNNKFEQWHIGELIQEPLNDRLRFAMIDLPFLRTMYLQHGYDEGLKLERAFGDYLRERVDHPARIYHFSDANLLYIEPNKDQLNDPEELFNKIKQWIKEFAPERKINRIFRVGMADYPFLPRAYTAVNDNELVDVLLMSTSAARTLSMKEHRSQWVYLKAIENAPAASLATGNIRKACKQSINQGLIKVHSSYKNEESIKKLLKDE